MSATGSLGERLGGRFGLVACAIALIWDLLLLATASFAPLYRSSSVTSSGAVNGTATLVEVNGWGVLLVVAVPLLATLLVGGALWHRGTRRGAGVLAWAVTGLLITFNFLAMMSIGVLVIPVTAALVAVCIRRRRIPEGP